jgi:UDP-glucose 4-epimerase
MRLNCASAVIGDLTQPQNLSTALAGVDAVIHSAGVPHGMTGLPEADHRAITVEGTRNLARAAHRARAKRFVFLSSIRAQTGPAADEVVTEELPASPTDAYGRAKLEAEKALAEVDMDWAALRPVLVYGPGMKGNLAALANLARSPYPLPLGGLTARRSLLALDNLADAVDTILRTAGTLRRPFIVADPDTLTVSEMIAAMRKGLGRRPGLVRVPGALLRIALETAGRGEWYERLARPLVADCSALTAIGWRAALSTREGLQALMKAQRQ